MPLHIDDVITPTLASEVETEILSLCATAGLSTSAWQPGSVVRTMIAEISEVIARRALVDVEIAKGGLGDLASPEWAKLWAQQIYNVLFIPSRAATGFINATNTTATPHDLNPGDLIVAHEVTGKTYRNQAAVTIAANATTEDIAIQADEVGTGSDAEPGAIEVIVAPAMLGVTVTNPAAVLGADEEKTEALVARTRAKLGSFSPNGPKDAYDYVARTPLAEFPMVEGTLLTSTDTPITRSRTTADPLTGEVIVYCATAGGAPTLTDVARVQLGIERWAEPHCVEATAAAAEELLIPISYRVWIRTSLTEDQVASSIAAALSRYVSVVPVGGVVVPPDTGAVYVEALTFVIHTAVPGIERVLVTLPAADLVVSPFQVPVLGTVTPTVRILR